jgi:hypothetical protein
MAGYAIQARIDGVRPRLTALDGQAWDEPAPGWTSMEVTPLPPDAPILAERGAEATRTDRFDRLREVWQQTTFFLFSADSWR